VRVTVKVEITPASLQKLNGWRGRQVTLSGRQYTLVNFGQGVDLAPYVDLGEPISAQSPVGRIEDLV